MFQVTFETAVTEGWFRQSCLHGPARRIVMKKFRTFRQQVKYAGVYILIRRPHFVLQHTFGNLYFPSPVLLNIEIYSRCPEDVYPPPPHGKSYPFTFQFPPIFPLFFYLSHFLYFLCFISPSQSLWHEPTSPSTGAMMIRPPPSWTL
jgi:hypothetical protein